MAQRHKGISRIRIWRAGGKRFEATNDERAVELERRFGKPDYVGYKAQFRRSGSRSKSRSFTTLDAAEKWLKEQLNAAETGQTPYDPQAMRRLTIKALLRQHEEMRAKRDLGYSESGKYRIDALVRRIGHISLMEAHNPHFWTRYCDARRREVSDATIARELNLIQGAWEAAKIYDRLPLPTGTDNPIRLGRSQARLTLGLERSRRLSAKEEAGIIEAAANYGHTRKLRGLYIHVIVLLIETAIARSDLMRLRWADVDLDNMELRVPPRRKGRRREKPGRVREFPLTQYAVDALTAIKEHLGETEFVMGTLKPATVSQAFRRIAQAAGIQDLTLHDLRHEGTSRFFKRGLSAMEASVYTGHRTIAMLQRYTHPSVEELRARIAAAEAAVGRSETTIECATIVPQAEKHDPRPLNYRTIHA